MTTDQPTPDNQDLEAALDPDIGLTVRVLNIRTTGDADTRIDNYREAILTLPPGWTSKQMVQHLEALNCKRLDNLRDPHPTIEGYTIEAYP